MAIVAPRAASQIVTRRPRRSPEELIRHRRRTRALELTLAVGIPACGIVLWQLASALEWIDPLLYPSPTDIGRAARDLFDEGRLQDDLSATLRLVVVGYLAGAAAGFLVGVALGVSRLVRRSLEPTLNALYVVPKLALLPIFLTIFGFGSGPKVVLVAVTVFFFVWIQTMEAVATVPVGYREAARSFGVSRMGMFRHVLLPASLPQVFVALRVSMGVAVLVIVAAEFVVGDQGLGYLIFNSRALFLLDRSYVGIVVVAVLGVLLAAVVAFIGRRLTPWATENSQR